MNVKNKNKTKQKHWNTTELFILIITVGMQSLSTLLEKEEKPILFPAPDEIFWCLFPATDDL